jgi:hypothetical protein
VRDAIFGKKADGAVECDADRFAGTLSLQKLADIGEVQDGEGEREFKHRLHRRMIVRMQFTIQRGARKEARNGDRALSVGGYAIDFYLQSRLGNGIDGEDGGAEESEKDGEGTHSFKASIYRGSAG